MLRCQENLVTNKTSEEWTVTLSCCLELTTSHSHPQTQRCGTPISHFWLITEQLWKRPFLNYRSTSTSTSSNTRRDLTLIGYSLSAVLWEWYSRWAYRAEPECCLTPRESKKCTLTLYENHQWSYIITPKTERWVFTDFYFPSILFSLRTTCFWPRGRAQYPISQNTCVQSFSTVAKIQVKGGPRQKQQN